MPPPPPPPPAPNVFLLAADNQLHTLLPLLSQHRALATQQDEHGYSLLHAAAAYDHADLARQLVRDYGLDPNVRDADGETALFQTERVAMARLLVEELGVDAGARDAEGMRAHEKMMEELDGGEEGLRVVAYLRGVVGDEGGEGGEEEHVSPRPPNLPIHLGTTVMVRDAAVDPATSTQGGGAGTGARRGEGDQSQVLDPDFRAKVERLAAREDFHDVAGQQELRQLVTQAVRGHGVVGPGSGPAAERERERKRR
ncbi:MAG: hypothetical protein M1826_006977 [Phylliscum demangeonii]|nr:MAG: hypothetical protein M1826_006977 [Phylliscum demangeonii]